MRHLQPEDIVDALDGSIAAAHQAHLSVCAECRALVADLAAMHVEARTVPMREPAPAFWDHFSSRVHHATAFEPVPGRANSGSTAAALRPRRWFSVPVLAPLAGLAVAVFALSVAVSREITMPQGQPGSFESQAVSAGAAGTTADETWAVISDAVGSVDIETAHEAGITMTIGTADQVALHLTALEQEELVRLLRLELRRAGS